MMAFKEKSSSRFTPRAYDLDSHVLYAVHSTKYEFRLD